MCVKIAFMVSQPARICNASEEPLGQSDDCSDGYSLSQHFPRYKDEEDIIIIAKNLWSQN